MVTGQILLTHMVDRKMIVETNRKNINFGIYKCTNYTKYGYRDYGTYKDKNIEIYHDTKDKSKLFYVSDILLNWIKYKLEYFNKGKKRTVISENGKL